MKKVVKFGGSSLADAKQFRKVAKLILADDDRRYVVVSAPGKGEGYPIKITDLLYSGKIENVKERFDKIIKDLDIELNLDPDFELIKKNIANGASKDYIASRGEFLSGKVMAKFLGFEFVDPAEAIVFDENKVCDFEKTNKGLKKKLQNVERAVIPGFYGANEKGEVVTFSRGGSDVTGSLVAKAIKADVYENWTDVSGCLIADPRIIENADPIDTITYAELRELAYMGASVLHEDAIFPVREDAIPINIKNTNRPEDPGTFIVESTVKKPKYVITGIAGKKGFCSVNIDKAMMNSEVGFCMKVLKVFADNNISIEHMPSGIDTMSVFVHQSEFEEKEQQVIAGIHRAVNPDSVHVDTGIALIAVVGRGMRSARGTAGRIFSALAHAGVNIKMIDQGSSEMNIIIGVQDSDFETAIRAIYDIYVTAAM